MPVYITSVPLHLAACEKVLMLVGPSYLTRLWCIMEIFVLIAAVNDMTRLECVALTESTENSPTASQAQAEEDVVSWFRSFSVSECNCYGSATRDKLLCIIEAGCGTLRQGQIRFAKKKSTSWRTPKLSAACSWLYRHF